jgi:hypothetical protein
MRSSISGWGFARMPPALFISALEYFGVGQAVATPPFKKAEALAVFI